jgi:hypothetical protein
MGRRRGALRRSVTVGVVTGGGFLLLPLPPAAVSPLSSAASDAACPKDVIPGSSPGTTQARRLACP